MTAKNKHGRVGVKRENPAKAPGSSTLDLQKAFEAGYNKGRQERARKEVNHDENGRGFQAGKEVAEREARKALQTLLPMKRAKDIHKAIEEIIF